MNDCSVNHSFHIKKAALCFLMAFITLLPMTQAASAADAASGDEVQYRSLAATAPKRAEKMKAYIALADHYRSRNMDEKALETIDEALGHHPKRKERCALLIRKGDILLARRHYAAAINVYSEAVAEMPRSEQAHLSLAGAYEQSELYELARQEYQQILERNRQSYQAHLRLASLYRQLGLTTQAMEHYRQALALKPDVSLYRQMAKCAEDAGDIQMAVTMLKQATSLEQNYDDCMMLGRMYREQKRYADAEELYSQAIKRDPGRVEGYLSLALLYLEKNDFVPAEKLLLIAREKEPEEGIIPFFLATIYSRQNDIPAAQREIKAAIRLSKSKTLENYSRLFEKYIIRNTLPK